MNREKLMNIFVVFVVVALVVSLIMNFQLISKLGDVENQLNSVTNWQHRLKSDLDDQRVHIDHVLDDIREQQSWISPIKMDVNPKDLEDGKAEATFEWQVKELQKDSEVVFHYTYGDNEDYTSVPVKETQQGMFQVDVPFEVNVEPEWFVHITATRNSQETSKKQMEEQSKKEMEENSLKYYVSVSYGDLVKSSEVHTEHLGYLGTNTYGTFQTNLMLEDKTFSVILANQHADHSTYEIEKVYLLKYEDGSLLGKEELKTDEQYDRRDPMIHSFQVNQIKQYEEMRLVIQVVYNNGKTFEKEIYQS
ncbi:hypothetical protein [Pseudalkalibacillus sp. SCS-8]|uniref:hypothetical protein n=1 Tax=Pseudalkalibacillus nanhaiensis TaxID=3115291 RepID=UPI0032DBA35C